jgi:hypothetical protein
MATEGSVSGHSFGARRRGYGAVAASVAAEKRDHPERFCIVPRCLWRTNGGENPCRNHQRPPTLVAKLEKSVELTGQGPLAADTPVLWDGEWSTWGELTQNERIQCERNAQGVLEGSNPF